jgi:hypothetical protein
MTDTTTTAESGYSTDPQEGPQTPPDGTLKHLDPNNLRLVDNVREYANLNKPFLGSIAERTNCSFKSRVIPRPPDLRRCELSHPMS